MRVHRRRAARTDRWRPAHERRDQQHHSRGWRGSGRAPASYSATSLAVLAGRAARTVPCRSQRRCCIRTAATATSMPVILSRRPVHRTWSHSARAEQPRRITDVADQGRHLRSRSMGSVHFRAVRLDPCSPPRRRPSMECAPAELTAALSNASKSFSGRFGHLVDDPFGEPWSAAATAWWAVPSSCLDSFPSQAGSISARYPACSEIFACAGHGPSRPMGRKRQSTALQQPGLPDRRRRAEEASIEALEHASGPVEAEPLGRRAESACASTSA